jgi:hypothetical protein
MCGICENEILTTIMGLVVCFSTFVLFFVVVFGAALSPLIYDYFYNRTVRRVDIKDVSENSPLWRELTKWDREKGWVWVNWRGHRATSLGEYGGYVL